MLLFWDGHDDFWVNRLIGKSSSDPSVELPHGMVGTSGILLRRRACWCGSSPYACHVGPNPDLLRKIFWSSKVPRWSWEHVKEVPICSKKILWISMEINILPPLTGSRWVGSHPGFQTQWFPNRTTWRWVPHPAPPWSLPLRFLH